MQKTEAKKIVGVQLPEDLYKATLDLAAENGTTISSAIRMVLIDYLKRYKGYKPTKKGTK